MIKWLEGIVSKFVTKTNNDPCRVKHDWQTVTSESEWGVYRDAKFSFEGRVHTLKLVIPDKYSPSSMLHNRVCLRCQKVDKQVDNFYDKLVEEAKNTLIRIERAKTIMNNSKGFTLIELLIVIAIIAILFAIAVPQISNAISYKYLECTSTTGRTLYTGEAKKITTDGNIWKFTLRNGDNVKLTGSCIEREVKEKKDDGYRSLN